MSTEAFDWGALISNVAGAAIGATAAFAFALWLTRLENDRARRERAAETRETNLLTINASVDACGQNIEELLNFKAQMVVPLTTDARTVEALLNEGNPEKIATDVSKLTHFFLELQLGSFIAIPRSDRFAFLLSEVPAITSLVHRAATSVEAVNRSIDLRNEMMRRWSDVGRGPVSHGDMQYFFRMLSSYARAIAAHVDDALFFNHVLHDQSYYVGLQHFTRPNFRHVVIIPEKAKLMPPGNHIKTYRDRMITFGFPKIAIADDEAFEAAPQNGATHPPSSAPR